MERKRERDERDDDPGQAEGRECLRDRRGRREDVSCDQRRAAGGREIRVVAPGRRCLRRRLPGAGRPGRQPAPGHPRIPRVPGAAPRLARRAADRGAGNGARLLRAVLTARSLGMPPIIEAHGLVKRFGDVDALAGLDLVAESGRITALLGPNGAGKTTFVSAVATLLRPDAGERRVAGIDVAADPRRVRRIIGLAGQYASVEPAMTGRENVELVARLFGLGRRAARAAAGEVLDRLGLGDAGDRLVRTYSGGMRRRLDLGASLVGRPRLLLLDEPTSGLDPRSRRDLWEAIRGLVADGVDVLLTTQYLEEADNLARHVVIIDHGRVIDAGTPDELKDRAGRDVIDVRPRAAGDLPAIEEILASISDDTPQSDIDTQRASVSVDTGADKLALVVKQLHDQGIALDDVGVRRPSLDEVFLSLTGAPVAPSGNGHDDQGH